MKLTHITFAIVLLILIHKSLAQNTKPYLDDKDLALIDEAYHLKNSLGYKIWPNWKTDFPPILYKKGGFDILINHGNPPADFKKIDFRFQNSAVYVKRNQDTISIAATYPLNSKSTVVRTAPRNDDNVVEWIIKTTHEMFHVYQDDMKSDRLKVEHAFNSEDYKNYNELNFPYEYYNDGLLAAHKIEADKLFKNISEAKISPGELKILQRRFADLFLIFQSLLEQESLIKFKLHMEWKEGVARYTEQKIAELASNSNLYQPLESFSNNFPEADYKTLGVRYKYKSNIAPIRFVGEGVIGKIMFYYTGMGKAHLLDKIKPDWKTEYSEKSLDEMIIGEKQFLACKSY